MSGQKGQKNPMANGLAAGLSGLKKPGASRKGTPKTSMTIEPLPPQSVTPKSELLAPPKKSGIPTASISPIPSAKLSMKAQAIPAHPGDITRPTASDISKI